MSKTHREINSTLIPNVILVSELKPNRPNDLNNVYVGGSIYSTTPLYIIKCINKHNPLQCANTCYNFKDCDAFKYDYNKKNCIMYSNLYNYKFY